MNNIIDTFWEGKKKEKPDKGLKPKKEVDQGELVDADVFEITKVKRPKKLLTSIQKIDRGELKLTNKEVASLMSYNICELGQFTDLMGWKSLASVNQFADKIDFVQPFISISGKRQGHKFVHFTEKTLTLLKNKAGYKL